MNGECARARDLQLLPYYNGWIKKVCYDSFQQRVTYISTDDEIKRYSQYNNSKIFGTCYNEDYAIGIISNILQTDATAIAHWLITTDSETLLLHYRSQSDCIGYVVYKGEKMHTCDARVVLKRCDNEIGFYVSAVRPVVIGV